MLGNLAVRLQLVSRKSYKGTDGHFQLRQALGAPEIRQVDDEAGRQHFGPQRP